MTAPLAALRARWEALGPHIQAETHSEAEDLLMEALARAETAERERDEWHEAYNENRRWIGRLSKERDALQARVAALEAGLKRVLTAHGVSAERAYYPDGSGCVCGGCDAGRALLAAAASEVT